jgi:AP-3 complex subunit sigma
VDDQQKLIRECFNLVSKRSDIMCNFVEGGDQWGRDTKLIYRHYATLYFVFCVDSSESELGILDLIHIFVEALDKSFENVCELDLIFHADKVPFYIIVASPICAPVPVISPPPPKTHLNGVRCITSSMSW